MTADFSLTGKVALVTGASSGIGRRQALALAQAGAAVVLLGRREAQLQEAVAEIEVVEARAAALSADLSDRDQLPKLAESRHGAFWLDRYIDQRCGGEFTPAG